ncbi:hypothetical protein DXA13_07665 [Clostridium sp. AM58-1XD]|nr:hypothetical protein DXA13_07665 [Clostridium sp. AM58-1XD]
MMIRIRWNSGLLKRGIRLMDIPGLDSFAGFRAQNSSESHDMITVRRIKECDAMMCLFEGDAVAGSMCSLVEEFLQNMDISDILVVINKADMVMNPGATAIALNNIFRKAEPEAFYFISSLAGEYRFAENGIPASEMKLWKQRREDYIELREADGKENVREEESARRWMKKRYERPYPVISGGKIREHYDFAKFLDRVVAGRADLYRTKLFMKASDWEREGYQRLKEAVSVRQIWLEKRDAISTDLSELIQMGIEKIYADFTSGMEKILTDIREDERELSQSIERLSKYLTEAFKLLNSESANQRAVQVENMTAIGGNCLIWNRSYGRRIPAALGRNYEILREMAKLEDGTGSSYVFQEAVIMRRGIYDKIASDRERWANGYKQLCCDVKNRMVLLYHYMVRPGISRRLSGMKETAGLYNEYIDTYGEAACRSAAEKLRYLTSDEFCGEQIEEEPVPFLWERLKERANDYFFLCS